jgi:hypothetical protein
VYLFCFWHEQQLHHHGGHSRTSNYLRAPQIILLLYILLLLFIYYLFYYFIFFIFILLYFLLIFFILIFIVLNSIFYCLLEVDGREVMCKLLKGREEERIWKEVCIKNKYLVP